jgi:alcohol dehydrogenase class IV
MKQEVMIGLGSIDRLPELLKERNFNNPCFVLGHHLPEELLNKWKSLWEGKAVFLFPSPGLPDTEVIRSYMEQITIDPDVLIAIGGGRIMDIAKYLAWMRHSSSAEKSDRIKTYFIAVPTTAGSGSEATPFAVVYSGGNKISIDLPYLLPQMVLLDPAPILALPAKQRAISGIDALAQAIESTWSKKATANSIELALSALSVLWKELAEFVNAGVAALVKRIQWAAYEAGKAIAITRTTGCHALSYYLTSRHGVPHGQAVAFFLPLFFLYNEQAADPNAMERIYKILGVSNAAGACAVVQMKIKECGLAVRFSDLSLEIDLDELVASVNQERFSNNPAAFDKETLKALMKQYLA